MALLAALLALALPLGLGAETSDGVAISADGGAQLAVQADGAVVAVPALGVAASAAPDGVAVQVPAGIAVRLPVPLGQEAPVPTDANEGDGAAASAATGSKAWVPEPTPQATAAGASVLGVGLAAALAVARLLGVMPWFPSFSRIEDADLARHPMRRMALDFIAANPGATIQGVRGALGIAWGTAVHHLARLERGGLVAVRRVGGRRGHWPLGQAPPRDALPPAGAALARLVLAEPGLAQGELARRAGLLVPATSKQLAKMASAGLVTARRDGRQVLYAPTRELAVALA